MKKKIHTSFILLLLFSILISNCAKDNTYIVDASVQPYFDLFEVEAQKRGIEVDLAKDLINGIVVEIADAAVYGQCATTSSTGVRTVRVDSEYWEIASAAEREFLIFHELGHCVLERGHLDTRDQDGNCISIMHSGTSPCRFRYVEERETYLEELFR